MRQLADGPCMRCGHRNEDVLLTGESWPANDGGTFWRVNAGEICANCYQLLTVFHERPIVLELPARVRSHVRLVRPDVVPDDDRARMAIVEGVGQVIKLTAIKPNAKRVDFTRFSAAAKLGLRDASDAALKDFEKTTASWSTQPDFTAKEQKDSVLIGTDNDVWNMLDKGTRAHRIIARRGKRLRFSGGFRAKTRPGFIGSQSGSSGTGGPVFVQSIDHPGTVARGWSKLIAAKYRTQLSRYIDARLREAR